MRLTLSLLLSLMISPLMSQPAQEFLSVIHQRTSIREYSDRLVEAGKVEALLRAAMAAPSSRNVQPWLFYVVQDPEMLATLADGLPTSRMAARAPLAIVVCGDTTRGNPNAEQVHNWIMDCSAATQNLLLAATALELGAVWTGIFPYQERIRVVREVLSLPDHIVPLSLIPIGYPAGEPSPKDKWDPEKIRYLGGPEKP
jgi:nitroreductase